jgi:hypothetical protein
VRKVGSACKSAVFAHAIEFTHPTRAPAVGSERIKNECAEAIAGAVSAPTSSAPTESRRIRRDEVRIS